MITLAFEPLTLEQREYKEKTLNHLQTTLPILEAKLAQENRRDVAASFQEQIEEVETHLVRLQKELTANVSLEPVADELCRQAASALTKQKFYLAKKYLGKLETIEPFYPNLERLKEEADSGQVSRRTRSIAQGNSLPTPEPARALTIVPNVTPPQPAAPAPPVIYPVEEEERRGISRFFEFHIIASCLVILLIVCAMAGVGGMSLLGWLIEGS